MFSPWLSVFISIIFFISVLSYAYFYNTRQLRGRKENEDFDYDDGQTAVISLLLKTTKTSTRQYYEAVNTSKERNKKKKKKTIGTQQQQSLFDDDDKHSSFLKKLALFHSIGIDTNGNNGFND